MPFEIIADFKNVPELTPAQRKWGEIATGIAAKLYEVEPRLRFRLRNYPVGGRTAFLPLTAHDVPKELHDRLEAPDPTMRWVRQYACHTCLTFEGKPRWVPQMYLSLHEGHELTRSEPTGLTKIPSWKDHWYVFRMFIGSQDRISTYGGSGIYSCGVTGRVDASCRALKHTVDELWITKGDPQLVAKATGIKMAHLLPHDSIEAVHALLAWMKATDSNALENDDNPTDPDEQVKSKEALEKRIMAAQAWIRQQVNR